MCKPDKSFNTGVQTSYLSSHERGFAKTSRAGGAPPRTDALIGPAVCGRCLNSDSLKRRASALSLSSLLTLLNSVELVEATLPVFATAPSNARRSAGRSPRNQPSEGV